MPKIVNKSKENAKKTIRGTTKEVRDVYLDEMC